MTEKPVPPEAPPWQAMMRGMRATLGAGLVLQVTGLALVLAYYYHPATRAVLGELAAFRARTGMVFGIVSTGVVGGLVPLLYLWSGPATRGRYSWKQGAGIVAFWAYKGAEIEWFYRFLAYAVGEGLGVRTIAMKMAIDQFIYCPLFAVPVTVLLYAWIDAGYDGAVVAADWKTPGWYRRRVLPVLIPNLAVWIPTVCLIYALPTPLQLPLQNVVLCFFTLLLAHVTQTESSRPADRATR
jgi:hypothetical protein